MEKIKTVVFVARNGKRIEEDFNNSNLADIQLRARALNWYIGTINNKDYNGLTANRLYL